MNASVSTLQAARAGYQPRLPKALRTGQVALQFGAVMEPASDREELRRQFPRTYGQRTVTFVAGKGQLTAAPLNVGVVLSGGQAPGGHNVIAGLYDALMAANPATTVYGFLNGPAGILTGQHRRLTADIIDAHRNTGGFSMIMSGRDKIEGAEKLSDCHRHLDELNLDGLVVIGGDDSNTNAAVLAEYLLANGCKTRVIGVPKTIDGDLKNDQIETSFGFDTATKTYAELIGNISRDAQSAVKYWHFIRLMGRAASHVTLECALQTQPNICLISEEVRAQRATLDDVVNSIVEIVIKRADAGKNYGILLVPEGLLEFLPDIQALIAELDQLLEQDKHENRPSVEPAERVQLMTRRLSAASAKVYQSLPADIQELLLVRDKHGYVPLSQIETERLLMDLVANKIKLRQKAGTATSVKFSPLNHFFGYEGRCAFPTNFDADYCYSLGCVAAQLIRAGVTGYIAQVQHLTEPHDAWTAGGTPLTALLNIEIRSAQPKPVIKKALVDLTGAPFRYFAAHRDEWAVNDAYLFPGPIQYFGPATVCDAPTKTLVWEKN